MQGHIRVAMRYTGKVQGVGFRATAQATASGFTVTGWVRNEPDGSVQMEAQGPSTDVERFLDALQERMTRAIKTKDRSNIEPIKSEAGFSVRK